MDIYIYSFLIWLKWNWFNQSFILRYSVLIVIFAQNYILQMIFYKWNFGFKSELLFYDIVFTLQNYLPTSLYEFSLMRI